MENISLSYDQMPMVEPYFYTTIPDRIRKHARDTPEKPAFVIHSVSGSRDVITCRDIHSQSLTFAKGLAHLGIEKGDTVGIAFPNSREWLVSTFGVQIVGAVPLHMNYKYNDGRDIIPVLQSVGNCKAIVMDQGNASLSREFIDKLIACIKTERSTSEAAQVCLPSLRFIIIDNLKIQGCLSFSDVLNRGITFNGKTDFPDLDPDDVAAYLLTSGSTGLSKLVPKTHLQMLEIGKRLTCGDSINSTDIFFNMSSFSWVAGYPTLFLVTGATHVTTRNQSTLNSIKDICDFFVRVIKLEHCTVSLLIPVFILEILKKEEAEFHQRIIIAGGVPVPMQCSGVVGRFSDELINIYGSTEMTSISMKRCKKSDYSAYCVGRPFPGFEMKIVDMNGKIVQKNQTGELLVRQHAVFSGYHQDVSNTGQVLNAAGWYKTDDSAYMDDNGEFFVIGRCSDIILCYGELIAPSYIEDQIREHPAVADVCVVPLSDPICFQKVCACIVVKTNASLKEDELRDFLSLHKIYKRKASVDTRVFLFFDSLPKTVVGKIFRKGVRMAAEKRLREQ